jgi:PLP dependent protein
MSNIRNNLQSVLQKIKAASDAADNTSQTVRLVAVSKGKPQEAVVAALEAGQLVFGENRVQEAKAKYSSLKLNYPHLELHLIGPLQTNKAEEAVKLFDVIQTIDRPKLAKHISEAATRTGRIPSCYIEVNIGLEPQKAGIEPNAVSEFLQYCQSTCKLNIVGLMCIPPQHSDPMPYFQKLKKLAEENGLKKLSMGMSADFEKAIRAGATEVRVGTAIFGSREVKP